MKDVTLTHIFLLHFIRTDLG